MNLVLSFLILLIVIAAAIATLAYTLSKKTPVKRKTLPFRVKKESSNPIIKPTKNGWHEQGTFNPGVVLDQTGRVHMLYRAVGADGISRFGYASSKDGIHFNDFVPYPVFALPNPRIEDGREMRYDMMMYPSGGSWGGVEDPRMVEINGTTYLTFNTFDNWQSIRMGVSSIKTEDLRNKRFKWSNVLFLSPKNQRNKNWVLFPEKIGGKFAILHSITPTVLIDYVDNLEELHYGSRKIQSHEPPEKWKNGSSWESHIRGAGPPPLKTPRGWLVLYHAMDKKDPGKYKLGAMLLDLKNPKKVIARAPAPILEPEMWYENDWKPGIVYACGAIIKDGELYIYYGGGDKYVAAAKAPLKPLLDWMIK